MARVINFNNTKKSYITVTLPEPDGRKLLVRTPTKNVLDGIVAIKEFGDGDDHATDALYELAATALSNNVQGIEVTPDDAAAMFDLSDVMLFFEKYSEFVLEEVKSKN